MSNRKTFAKTASIICAIAILAGCASGGNGNGGSNSSATNSPSTEKPAAPVKLSIVQQDGGRVWKADNPAIVELERQTNTDLDVNMIPAGEIMNKYNLMAASASIPDISKLPNFEFQKYADNGLFLEVTDLIEEHAPNLKKLISKDMWDLVKYKGKQLAIPYVNVPAKIVPVVRQDWLDTLGLQPPTNLEQYEEVLKQFTKNDPDKNGQDDTYGLGATGNWKGDFTMIFGAFGIMPFDSGNIRQSYLKDDTIYPSQIASEYKEAITYIKGLWDQKLIDPELFIIKGDQANQKLVQSKAGTFTAWWSIAPQVLKVNLKMNEINPAMVWDPIVPAIVGPTGQSGLESRGSINGTINISAKAKDPVAAIKFLDYVATDEGWELANYGIKGEHYNDVLEGRTEAGNKAMEEKWLDPLAQIINRNDIMDKIAQSSTDPVQQENNRFIYAAREYNLYEDVFFGVPMTDDQKTYGPDLEKYEDEMFIKFVTGVESLSNWDQYVDNWKNKGGKAIHESRTKAYNELKGTSYKAGV
ncbi:hypothetical protein BK133_25105 [Paenibacillus sp. FSL H8-0548]|uniref:extracellular solute-binding protein n=1 Tax=Paenibacillus sp. FSL H8-0548 TaxID=1920422 RepID=UPI00096D0997|nr:extracellular solute-binding protein [Paenibacillus sp. FSL H8-0548]OMF22934.1 hypothetical protein BK133_25105 [Paenibacillus sp. FSL H8-0548]